MIIKACIFDLDGVIVDTAKYHYLAWNRLANELGFEFSIEHNERLKGVSRMTSLDILLEVGGLTYSNAEKVVMAARKNEWYLEYIYKMTPDEILPGVISFLTMLREKGIKISLGSASKNAMLILERVQLQSFFDAVIDGNKALKAKPDPQVFLLAAQELNENPTNCVVFEDAAAGIEAALAAGMKCIGIGSPEILGRADKVVPGFENANIELIKF
ncbi:beta-phosphoglucomutase [Williamwhitmania taraxaci]|uniref:Beta-phosphoglucomutase n=1 Tax=Williamwhitmania taraxaci TaxID=1640674 RepID=A0A1G6HU34_9BACT|nr:beta-phosphoglucomutase [Williamwhitmania taraxaci]SDB97673.1 beta-phosphoglucomutase [Williamwhitmania taraxaci]